MIRNRLRSWMVKVKSSGYSRTTDSWGDPHYFKKIHSHYVVARTKKDAVSQAKRMAGYTTDKERETMGGVHLVLVLSDLEAE